MDKQSLQKLNVHAIISLHYFGVGAGTGLKSKGGGVTGANNPPADVWRNVTQRGHRAAILQRSLTTQ